MVIIICTTCFYLKNSALHMQCAYVFFFFTILTIYSNLSVRWKRAPTIFTYEEKEGFKKPFWMQQKINFNRPNRNLVATTLPVASHSVVIYFEKTYSLFIKMATHSTEKLLSVLELLCHNILKPSTYKPFKMRAIPITFTTVFTDVKFLHLF